MNDVLRGTILEKFRTQSAFAEAAGMSETYVSLVIHEERRLSPNAEKQWARLLGVKPNLIFPHGSGRKAKHI